MKLWERFTSLAKGKPAAAADLRQTRDEFVADRNRLANELDLGNGQKAEILRTGGREAFRAHQEKLRNVADDIEARNIAIAELDRQIEQAEKAEEASAFEQRAVAAGKAMGELVKVRATFFEQAATLLKTIEQGGELNLLVKAFNVEAATAGRSDLKVLDDELAAVNAGRSVSPIGHPLADILLKQRLEAALSFDKLRQRLTDAA